MESISKNFSGVFKIMLAIAAVLIFIRIFPWLILIGVVAYGGNKLIKYIRKHKSGKIRKSDIKGEIYEEQNYYDFSDKKVVDVDFEEVKR